MYMRIRLYRESYLRSHVCAPVYTYARTYMRSSPHCRSLCVCMLYIVIPCMSFWMSNCRYRVHTRMRNSVCVASAKPGSFDSQTWHKLFQMLMSTCTCHIGMLSSCTHLMHAATIILRCCYIRDTQGQLTEIRALRAHAHALDSVRMPVHLTALDGLFAVLVEQVVPQEYFTSVCVIITCLF
jgi:hypothetical protein